MEKSEETQGVKSKEKASPHHKSRASEPPLKTVCTRYQKTKAASRQYALQESEEFESPVKDLYLGQNKEVSASVSDFHKEAACQISAEPSSKSEDFEIPLKRSGIKCWFEQSPISMDTSQSKFEIVPYGKGLPDDDELSKSCNDEVVEPI
ncbi:conserved hypothetical protein [Ricinus communis]|uniref:Uncharacterized protein n=1 Tax=Ricinus communis TaxID=3988 RepID=B9SQU3_RICCO|nr:conserved hypothetical protein [Ricinus communis]